MPAMLLGEMLLKAGALTEDQLEQVLNAQSIYGGRLGTNLVEMGLIGEDELAQVLNEKLGVPCVEPAALNAVPQEVLTVVPQEMVQRHRVVPVAREGRRLTLAMADPSDFKAIDEIGFVTGLIVVPRVCSELRLSIALERYYGIKRTVRYIPVAGGARTRFAGELAGEGGDADPVPVQGALQEPVLTNGSGYDDYPEHAHGCGQLDGECGQPGSVSRWLTKEVLADRLADAPTEAQVVAALIWYLGGEFDSASFMTVREGKACGIQAITAGSEVETFPGFSIPLADAPPLRWAVQEKHPWMGEISAGGPGELLKAMGSTPPAPASVTPVVVGGQVGALICVNDRKGRLSGGLFELQRIASMTELAFEMLRIRKRIKAC
jgi:hypothetical protein